MVIFTQKEYEELKRFIDTIKEKSAAFKEESWHDSSFLMSAEEERRLNTRLRDIEE